MTENPDAFRRRVLSGPEMVTRLKQFDEEYIPETGMPEYCQYHKRSLSRQKTFQRHVTSLSHTIRRMGNPFLDDFPDLVTLDSRNCTDESVIEAIRSLEGTGKNSAMISSRMCLMCADTPSMTH